MDTEADWAETKTILQEVEKLFQTDDDIKDVLEIQKLKKEIGSTLCKITGERMSTEFLM